MTLEELGSALAATGIPTTYYSWAEDDQNRPDLPFICYLVAYSNNFFADSKTYHRIDHVQIELYTAVKDPTTEETVEDVLYELEIPWEKSEVYLDSENCFQIVYEIEV